MCSSDLDGTVGLSSFDEARLARPALQSLLRRTRLVWDPDIPAEFPRMEVRVLLDDGRVGRADRWPGHWKSPASEAELLEKFLACAESCLRPADARSLAAMLGEVDALREIAPLVGLLARFARG